MDRYTPCAACGGLGPLGPCDPAPSGSYPCECGPARRDEEDYQHAVDAYDRRAGEGGGPACLR